MSYKDELKEFIGIVEEYTLEKPERKPKQNYMSILVIRELLSAARFTTDGTEANSAIIRINGVEETVGKLFGRKQVASDRRLAKSVQRSLIVDEMNNYMGKKGWDGCTMEVTSMCQKCPECALFGSAASDEGVSITSRVMYDEAYTIRSIGTIVEDVFQNAPGDSYAKEPTPGIREPDFFKEGTLFPCVITLRDVTPEEVLFFLDVTDRNTRYGATGTRFGKTKNHIVGVYGSHREGPSSLEVTKGLVEALTSESDSNNPIESVVSSDTLPVEDIKSKAKQIYEKLCDENRVKNKEINSEILNSVLDCLKDEEKLKEILVAQIQNNNEYLDFGKR